MMMVMMMIILMTMMIKGRVSHFFFILAQVPLGIIYDGKIVETGRSDLETVQKCKNSVF